MGGDFAPFAILEGAIKSAQSGIPILLVGPKDLILDYLISLPCDWKSLPLEIEDSHQMIEMGEEPVKAVLSKKQSSLVLAVNSVKVGKSRAVLSAGNSGALMAAATFILGRVEGIDRAPIAGFLPGLKGGVLCLDLGANTECKPTSLEKFAELGSKYLQTSLNIKNPKIGLLSNGSENGKGSALVKEAFKLLEKSNLNFIGNVEPKDIIENKADIVVCDGFSGNVLLKSFEAMTFMFREMFALQLAKENDPAKKIVIDNWGKSFWENVASLADWTKQGGGLLLGVNGTVVVAHGCSNAIAIENAINLAWSASNKK